MLSVHEVVSRAAPAARSAGSFVHRWALHAAMIVGVGIVMMIAPKQTGLLVYKATLLLIAAIGAYWINRMLFHRRAHESDLHGQWQMTAMICAAMLAAGLAA